MIPDGFWSNRPGLWRWGLGLICLSLFEALIILFYLIFRQKIGINQIIILSVSALTGIIFIALTAGKPRRQLPPGKIGLWDNRAVLWKIGLVLFILSVYSTTCDIIDNDYYFTLQFSGHGYLGVMLMLQGERKRLGSLSDVLKIKTSIWWIALLCVLIQITFSILSFSFLQSLRDIFKILTYNARGIVGLIIVILCIYNSN